MSIICIRHTDVTLLRNLAKRDDALVVFASSNNQETVYTYNSTSAETQFYKGYSPHSKK